MKFSWIIGCLLAGSVQAATESVLPFDPIYAPGPVSPGAIRYSVKIRFVDHATHVAPEILDRLVRATEKIYSQCEGVDFHVEVVSRVPGLADPRVRAAQGGVDSGTETLGPDFVAYYSPWMASRIDKTVDVHLVDRMDEISLGHAFNGALMDRLFKITWSSDVSALAPSQIAGNVVTLAIGKMLADESSKTFMRAPGEPLTSKKFASGWYEMKSSLLAHELGHILLEDESTFDHRCVGSADGACPRTNVMSAGGADEKKYLKAPKFKDVAGYSPLPEVEAHQCEVLRKHEWVQR